MKKDFQELIARCCQLCGVQEAEAVAEGKTVEVDGVAFSIIYDEELAPDRLMLYSDYGAVPTGKEASVYRALLETNLLMHPTDTLVFTASPETGRVIGAVRLSLHGTNAEELLRAMIVLSTNAKQWRKDHFDTAQPTSQASIGRALNSVTKDLLGARRMAKNS